METRDIIARPITALEDAEVHAERLRARLHDGDLEGAQRAVALLEQTLRAGARILHARRERVR